MVLLMLFVNKIVEIKYILLKKELTVDVYRELGKNVFDLNIADGITIGNTEIININSALNNRPNIAILLTNNKRIQFINFIWKAVYHYS